jgi:chorismate-pyruvate lyase
MYRVYHVKNLPFTVDDIHKLEAISNRILDLVQRLLLIDLGNTQHLLEVINNTETKIKVIEQVEEKNVIKRKSCIISSNNNILAYANSRIYSKKIPLEVLEEIREQKYGIGKILLSHRLEIFKKITEIGFTTELHIFRNYFLYHKEQPICRINEVFPMKVHKRSTK